MKNRKWIAVLAALALLLGGCGAPTEMVSAFKEAVAAPAGNTEAAANTPVTPGKSLSSGSGGSFVSPPFLDAVFHEEEAEGIEGVKLDLSATQDGYVAISAVSEMRLKFQVICGEETYTYDLASDGTPSIFPLSCEGDCSIVG